MQSGQERFSAPPVDSAQQSLQPQRPLILFCGTEQSLELARCWQFYWRAAGEPRAPSTVS
jgi:hypothetical protein